MLTRIVEEGRNEVCGLGVGGRWWWLCLGQTAFTRTRTSYTNTPTSKQKQPVAKLSDFGLSRSVERFMTQCTGNAYYLAPGASVDDWVFGGLSGWMRWFAMGGWVVVGWVDG